jgi:hypothetical protein
MCSAEDENSKVKQLGSKGERDERNENQQRYRENGRRMN